ncbi:MAG: DinB family protein, partial [Mucilaginibacter sp.]
EGSWTAGQVMEHINMVGMGFCKLINGATETTTRRVDEHVERITTMFLNFGAKNIASPDIVPVLADYNLQDQLAKLESIKTSIINDINTLDMSMTCLDFDIRTFGHLTRLEAVYFFLFHTKKHIHQLQNIVKKLNNPAYSI